MKGTDIIKSENLTLLAKAYYEDLFPKATFGEIFYKMNWKTGPERLFFTENYYQKLWSHINSVDLREKIARSNASHSWLSLIDFLNNVHSINDNEFDYGEVDNYTPSLTNYNELIIPDERVEKVLNTPIKQVVNIKDFKEQIKGDIKKIFIGIDCTLSGLEGGTIGFSIHLPYKENENQKFNYRPAFQLAEKYGLTIVEVYLFKGKNKNSIWTSIKLGNWPTF